MLSTHLTAAATSLTDRFSGSIRDQGFYHGVSNLLLQFLCLNFSGCVPHRYGSRFCTLSWGFCCWLFRVQAVRCLCGYWRRGPRRTEQAICGAISRDAVREALWREICSCRSCPLRLPDSRFSGPRLCCRFCRWWWLAGSWWTGSGNCRWRSPQSVTNIPTMVPMILASVIPILLGILIVVNPFQTAKIVVMVFGLSLVADGASDFLTVLLDKRSATPAGK